MPKTFPVIRIHWNLFLSTSHNHFFILIFKCNTHHVILDMNIGFFVPKMEELFTKQSDKRRLYSQTHIVIQLFSVVFCFKQKCFFFSLIHCHYRKYELEGWRKKFNQTFSLHFLPSPQSFSAFLFCLHFLFFPRFYRWKNSFFLFVD